MAALIALTLLGCAALVAVVSAVVFTTSALAERDRALMVKLAELMHTHMPVGEPIAIVQKKLDLQQRREEEVARDNQFKRERIALKMQQLADRDPEQDQ